jgi:hypothetical protein
MTVAATSSQLNDCCCDVVRLRTIIDRAMKTRPIKAFIGKDSQRSLGHVVKALNEATRTCAHSKLLHLVTVLMKSGDLQKVCADDPVLNKILRSAIRVGYRPSSSAGATLELMPEIFSDPRDYADMLKRYYHRRSPKEAQSLLRAEREDYLLFLALTLGDWQHLGGPCGRCGRWYIKKRISQKTYCQRRCATAATAIATTKQQRKLAHARLLEQAQRALQRWRPNTRLDPKGFASRETGLTRKWLTRAINRGELQGGTQC